MQPLKVQDEPRTSISSASKFFFVRFPFGLPLSVTHRTVRPSWPSEFNSLTSASVSGCAHLGTRSFRDAATGAAAAASAGATGAGAGAAAAAAATGAAAEDGKAAAATGATAAAAARAASGLEKSGSTATPDRSALLLVRRAVRPGELDAIVERLRLKKNPLFSLQPTTTT